MERKKKKKRAVWKRWLLVAALLLAVLLVFDPWGLGRGRGGLPAPVEEAAEAPAEGESAVNEVRITVTEEEIHVQGDLYTIEELTHRLDENDREILYLLSDDHANYAVFSRVEGLLEEGGHRYLIEE